MINTCSCMLIVFLGVQYCSSVTAKEKTGLLTFTWETNRTDIYHVRCDFESGEQITFFSLYGYRDQYNRDKYNLIKRRRTMNWFQIYIYHITPEDEGLYCCAWLDEEYSQLHTETAVLNITYDPIIQIYGETAVIEGDMLNITCFSQAFVPSTFLWYNLSQHGYWYSLNGTGDSLIIESADRKNSGKYKCLAKNDVISGSAEISVTIQYPPDIQVINRSDSVDCIVRGVPNVYTFYKWNHQSEYGEHIRFLDGFANGTLTLDNTEYPYMRNGIYTCTASNGIRDSNGDIKQTGSHLIKIPGKPVFLNTSYQTNLCSLKRNCELTFYVYSNPSVDRVELKRLNEQENKNRVQFKTTSEKQMLPTCWKTFHITGYKIEITSGILEEYDFTTYELKIWNLYDSTSFNFAIVPVEDIPKSNKLKMYLAIFITLSSVLFLYIVASHIWFYRRRKQSSLDGDNHTESYDEIGTIPSEIINFHPLSEQQQRIVRIDVEHESITDAEDRNDSSDLSSNHPSIHESSNNNQYLSSNDAIQQDLGETETDSLSWQDVEVDQKHEYQNLYQSIMQEMADSSSIHLTESDVQPPENQLAKRRYINLQI